MYVDSVPAKKVGDNGDFKYSAILGMIHSVDTEWSFMINVRHSDLNVEKSCNIVQCDSGVSLNVHFKLCDTL